FESRSAEKVLLGLLPAKLNYVLLCLAGIAPEERFEMRRGDRGRTERNFRIEDLAGLIKRFPLTIIGTNPFEAAQVTAGGVCMDELSQETLEAVRVPGLYVTGELADVDGTCGGYNLHWAWMSGMAAAESIIRNEGNGL
ncbi:MAG: NAD(P)/FAD-dependent oxidoreductase, partial [Lachnospiraceae bacterium]|nr:NAD(P)/FAD-dependent oxidoreductase [Lachnospiraceae bacterium]